eukprot:4313870-Prymnesium_polylepis.1
MYAAQPAAAFCSGGGCAQIGMATGADARMSSRDRSTRTDRTDADAVLSAVRRRRTTSVSPRPTGWKGCR